MRVSLRAYLYGTILESITPHLIKYKSKRCMSYLTVDVVYENLDQIIITYNNTEVNNFKKLKIIFLGTQSNRKFIHFSNRYHCCNSNMYKKKYHVLQSTLPVISTTEFIRVAYLPNIYKEI